MLKALEQYIKEKDAANNIGIVFVRDEEVTKTGAVAFAHQQPQTLNLRPVVAHIGVTRAIISIKGGAAHPSNNANGRSAITAMCRVVQLLEAEYVPSLRQLIR